MSYVAPVQDMLFDMRELAGLAEIAALPGAEHADVETAEAVLGECARFCGDVLAPLNREGDIRPSSWKDGVVTTTPGFKEAFRGFAEGGWQGLQHPEAHGGQDLPKTIGAACSEMVNSANLSFALCPLLTDGAIEAMLVAGSPEQQALYLPKLVSGEWTGTMNLTEPQAGSDLALVRTRAEPVGDGSYRIFGTKIYITYGEHDLAENIVHLVLARISGAPEGVKGISLFVVPKFRVDADGRPGERNDVWCTSIEHKLGIKASPTAVLQFGDSGAGAIGHLVGAENRGLEAMFIMMNAARFASACRASRGGAGVPEGVAFARERSVAARSTAPCRAAPPSSHHPGRAANADDDPGASTEGCRAMAIVAAAASMRRTTPDADVRRQNPVLEFMVPLVKGYSTEMSSRCELGVQVHGGMAFIEETGRRSICASAHPDHLRRHDGDPGQRVGRKTARDGGQRPARIARQVAATEAELERPRSAAAAMRKRLRAAREAFAAGRRLRRREHRSRRTRCSPDRYPT
jgi:alkylation response protein AidB-like acyl-CoA dehydrogenase